MYSVVILRINWDKVYQWEVNEKIEENLKDKWQQCCIYSLAFLYYVYLDLGSGQQSPLVAFKKNTISLVQNKHFR